MKRAPTILLTLMLFLAFTATREADAKWWKKSKGEARTPNVQRLDRMPTMGFYSGILNTGVHGECDLDGIPVRLSSDCAIWEAGSKVVQVRDGATVVLMGQKVGGVILAHQVVTEAPHSCFPGETKKNPSVTWSDSDPTVGRGGPPECNMN